MLPLGGTGYTVHRISVIHLTNACKFKMIFESSVDEIKSERNTKYIEEQLLFIHGVYSQNYGLSSSQVRM